MESLEEFGEAVAATERCLCVVFSADFDPKSVALSDAIEEHLVDYGAKGVNFLFLDLGSAEVEEFACDDLAARRLARCSSTFPRSKKKKKKEKKKKQNKINAGPEEPGANPSATEEESAAAVCGTQRRPGRGRKKAADNINSRRGAIRSYNCATSSASRRAIRLARLSTHPLVLSGLGVAHAPWCCSESDIYTESRRTERERARERESKKKSKRESKRR